MLRDYTEVEFVVLLFGSSSVGIEIRAVAPPSEAESMQSREQKVCYLCLLPIKVFMHTTAASLITKTPSPSTPPPHPYPSYQASPPPSSSP